MAYSTDKPFKKLDALLKTLTDRGMYIEDKGYARKVLLNNNYYSVINGYKTPFLQKDLKNQIVKPEHFIEGTNFSDVYALYNFDRDLRNIVLSNLLLFESRLKSVISYEFAEAFPDPYSYLDINNYSNDSKDLSNVLKNFKNLSLRLNSGRNGNYGKPSIIHYVKKHTHVPIWVLINTLTFGETQYFYDALNEQVKNNVTREFSKSYKIDWSTAEKIDIGELKDLIVVSNLFRNVCAHGERLFNYQLRTKIRKNNFCKYYNSNPGLENTDKRVDLYVLISLLALVLSHKEFKEMLYQIDRSVGQCDKKMKSIKMTDVYDLMGFPTDHWSSKIAVKRNTI